MKEVTFYKPGMLAFAACVVSGVLCSGCGLTLKQKSAAQSFGAATAALGTLTGQEFPQDRADVIAMNESRLSLGDNTVNAIDGWYTPERVKDRIEAVSALKNYGDLLGSLITNSQSTQIQSSANSFVSALGSVKGVTLTSTQSDAISAAVQAIGGLVVEYERKKAVIAVINNSQSSIETIVDLIASDFDTNQDQWALAYNTTVLAVQGQVNSILNAKTNGIAANDYASRAIVQDSLDHANANNQRFLTAAESISKSCSSLKVAQKNLVQVIKDDKLSVQDIQNYAKSVQEFVALYKAMSNSK